MTTQTEADVRLLAKWLNEEQTAPIDKQALARVLAKMQEQQEQEPVAHFGSAYVNENGVHVTTVLGPVAIPQDAKLYTTPPQPKELEQEPWLLETTQTLAKHMAREFYPEVTQWECLDNLAGVISQIDNMTTGLMRKPEQEPVAWPIETNNQVEALAKRCGWDNRRYMTPEDYQIWCDRMRQFVQLATPPQPKEPEQEPVALEQERKAFEEWIDSSFINKGHAAFHKFSDRDAYCIDEIQNKWKAWKERAKRYTTPPQRKPLTEQEIWDAVQQGVVGSIGFLSKAVAVARAIEAAHGIKE